MSFLQRFIETNLRPALADITATASKRHLIGTLVWQELASLYKRSQIGAFWITIATAISIASVGLVFGQLFQSPMKEFLPYFTIGTILWGFISSSLNQGGASFIAASGIILQVRMPLFTHVMKVLYGNAMVAAHNAVILPVVFLVMLRPPALTSFLAIPGLLLVMLNLGWMMLILAVVCTRFRDMAQIVQNALNVLMFVTPIMWNPKQLPEKTAAILLDFNPFYHLISIVRSPLMGELATLRNWEVSCGLVILGWAVAIPFFGRYRNRIAYWL